MENLYKKIISLDNLLLSWKEFRNGKRNKTDVQEFELNLEDNLFELHEELASMEYKHSNYSSFYITDPKQRHIHKAEVRDRIVHHAVHRILYPIFDKFFIAGSYSCRLKKGTHLAVIKLQKLTRKVSNNYTGPCFALKCDVKKFFDSVDHSVLPKLISKKITDADTVDLLQKIIDSFGRSYIQPTLFSREREREREREFAAFGRLWHRHPNWQFN